MQRLVTCSFTFAHAVSVKDTAALSLAAIVLCIATTVPRTFVCVALACDSLIIRRATLVSFLIVAVSAIVGAWAVLVVRWAAIWVA